MWIRAIAVIAACALSGCAGISGSSSMRVEVEVYKGPLSLEPAAQWGELRGLLEQGALAFRAAHQRYLLFAKDELDREGVRSDWVFEGRSEEWHEKSVARTRALGEADMARQRQHVVEQTSWLRRLLGWTTGDSGKVPEHHGEQGGCSHRGGGRIGETRDRQPTAPRSGVLPSVGAGGR